MESKKVLITGGTGFIGSRLTEYLIKKEYDIVVFDKNISKPLKGVTYVKGNLLSRKNLEDLFGKYRGFQTLFHIAGRLPNGTTPKKEIWEANIEGTLNIIEKAIQAKIKSFVFTSSNTVYGIPSHNPVTEDTKLLPLEVYGKSKVEAEKQLEKYKNEINIQIFRCPVVSGIGRLGLLSILFDFIAENKNVYVLGGGLNKYQFLDIYDLCDALEKASKKKGFAIYNIGADKVCTLRELYLSIISHAKSKSKIVSIPQAPARLLLTILDKAGISPIGVYQANMLGQSLYARTEKVKKNLSWKPKKTNVRMFIENYDWYLKNKNNLNKLDPTSNNSPAKMGILNLVKFFS